MTKLEILLDEDNAQMVGAKYIYGLMSEKGKLLSLYLFNRLLKTKIGNMGKVSKAELAVKLADHLSN